MRNLGALVLLSAALGLTACENPASPGAVQPEMVEPPSSPPVGGAPLTYVCQSGASVTARYPDADTAVLTYGGRESTLRVAPSGSGARYVGGEYEWLTATREGEQRGLLSRVVAGRDAEAIEQCARPADAAGSTAPPTPVEPAAPPACTSATLAAVVEGGDAGAGNRVTILSLQNTGAQPCTIEGYPSISLMGPDTAALRQVRAENTPSSDYRSGQTGAVVLSVQGKAFFDVAWSAIPHEDIGETACPSANGIRITPPGDTGAVTVVSDMQPCGRRVRVSPLRAVAEPDRSGV